MLNSLHLENLTVFRDAKFEFAKNLNLITGENSVGKSHVLKAAYVLTNVSAKAGRDAATKAQLQRMLADKLVGVFKPDELGRLVTRVHGNARCRVRGEFVPQTLNLGFSFHTRSKNEVTVEEMPTAWVEKTPVFLPTRELLTIAPGFMSIYETTDLDFEETWRDACILLGAPLARGPREQAIKEMLKPLENAMGGRIETDKSGRFLLRNKTGVMEIYLVAEGLRKLAMVARLIATGSLLDKGYLFWDEPEANLNPRIVRLVARVIIDLSAAGVQVFVATHSLFLMRELQMLQLRPAYNGLKTQCFGLHQGEDGVRVVQGPSMDDIGHIVSLDEELSQSERYLEADS